MTRIRLQRACAKFPNENGQKGRFAALAFANDRYFLKNRKGAYLMIIERGDSDEHPQNKLF